MDRRLGIALIVALGAALFTIAYLLGRQTATAPSVVIVNQPAATSGGDGAAPAEGGAGEASDVTPAAANVPGATESMATADERPASGTPAPETPSASTETPREEVARYFSEVEALQSASKGWTGDPQAVAREIVTHAANGDTSGLQRLIDANRRLVDGLRALATPAACATHLQKTLETLDAADKLLLKMKTAIQGQDIGGLALLASAGQDVERRAKEADALAAEIKSRYGL